MSDCDCSKDCINTRAKGYVFACAGGSNIGKLTYELALELHNNNHYQISCAAGVGADICGFKESVTDSETASLLLDGCPVSCLKTMFDNKGIKNYKQVILTELPLIKEQVLDYNRELLKTLVREIINCQEGK